MSGGGINTCYFYPPSSPPIMPVCLHRKEKQWLSFPHIVLLPTVLKHGTPECITCLFCIIGHWFSLSINFLKLCNIVPPISIITSQRSKRLQLIDVLWSMFSPEGRDHLSEMSTWGFSVCFSMIRSCCCLGFVSLGSGSLLTDGWCSQITPQGITPTLKYESKWRKQVDI